MKNKKLILIVEDEISMRKNLSDLLISENFLIEEASDGEEAVEKIFSLKPDIILLDVNLPKKDGLQVLKECKDKNVTAPIIILTAFGTSERAIEAMKHGAFEYIEKPFDLDEFLFTIKKATEYIQTLSEYKDQIIETETISQPKNYLVGKSSKMQEIFKLVGKVALSDATVLIQGESGTGKELIADAIQRHSLRNNKPYVKVNCGALTESLLESEIFGHEKGAFTGAMVQKKGKFELAEGGTIFLDEINNMPHSLQIKLLRILQNQPFYRVGGESPINVNVRIIAASNIDVDDAVIKGHLRKDLFYRLNVVRINLPALKNRREDIPLLINHFLNKYSKNKNITINEDTYKAIINYSWPGNVRELENLIQRILVIARNNVIDKSYLPIQFTEENKTFEPVISMQFLFDQIATNQKSFKDIIDDVEKSLIVAALKASDWNKTKASSLLKIHRKLLYTKIIEHNIQPEV